MSGGHYPEIEFHGDEPPNNGGYHRVGAKCFPEKKGEHRRGTDDEDSSGESWITSSADPETE